MPAGKAQGRDERRRATRTIALLLEYEGTRYHGFQFQKNATTIQGVLEEALNSMTGEGTRVRGAGRTDAGVHARGQVAAFRTGERHTPEAFVRGLNHFLPADVAARAACEVPADFNPRRHATSRHYRYRVHNQQARPALGRQYALWVREPLDVAAMDDAAQQLCGKHDLRSFSGPLDRPYGGTVREVRSATVTADGPEIAFDIEANAFLPQQVRRTTGVLLAVGRGDAPADRVRELRDRPVFGAAWPAAPPHGLCLMGVTYPIRLFEDQV